jgi:hypothetical protein
MNRKAENVARLLERYEAGYRSAGRTEDDPEVYARKRSLFNTVQGADFGAGPGHPKHPAERARVFLAREEFLALTTQGTPEVVEGLAWDRPASLHGWALLTALHELAAEGHGLATRLTDALQLRVGWRIWCRLGSDEDCTTPAARLGYGLAEYDNERGGGCLPTASDAEEVFPL